tara:strand:+ start:1348 stop:1740 length:393 start_codon:yes stop_codon:yes gene_type:complete
MFNVKEPGMSAASRERYHRELSYLKATLDYDVISRQNDDISTRRALITDIRRNYPEIQDLVYCDLMNMELSELHELLETKKMEVKMQAAARSLQRCYRIYAFRKFCFRSRMKKNQCAGRLQRQWKVHRQR